MSESKIQANTIQNSVRKDYVALRGHYEGVGVNDLDLFKSDKTLESILYIGDRNTHMCWG